MRIPTPAELIDTYGPKTPEQLAGALGFRVERRFAGPALPGAEVLSEYQPEGTILLYRRELARAARQRGVPLRSLEQWHIAHELYHGLAESEGVSGWRLRETDADSWADELLALAPAAAPEGIGASPADHPSSRRT